MKTHVIKRNNTIENFDVKKLQISIYRSCLAVHVSDTKAKKYSQEVATRLGKWGKKHPEASTNDIRKTASEYLNDFDSHASYLYAHHRIIL